MPPAVATRALVAGVKYTFVTAVEACIDVAHHVCATQGWGPPRDNGDALRLLGAHAVLTEDLAARMRRATGFRNVLVEDYTAIDDDVVLARLADPDGLRQFVAAVAELSGCDAERLSAAGRC